MAINTDLFIDIPEKPYYRTDNVIIYQGDSLCLLKQIPSSSISLILTDPPYHSTKKKNIKGDTDFEKDSDYILWMNEYAKEWKRIIRPNGSIFCFCSPSMSSKLEVMFSRDFNILAQIVWTKPNLPGYDGWKQKMRKEALRQWYSHSERIIFMEPAFDGNLFRSYAANLLKAWRIQAGLSLKELTEIIGAYDRVNHGGAVSNWEAGRNTPSKEQFEKIKKALLDTGKIESIPSYETIFRPFNVDSSVEYTDIWTFQNVRQYKGKHPAEKPIDLLKHAILATTYPGDIVLDCFSGSGSTAIAALELNRKAICIEIEEQWCFYTQKKIEALAQKSKQFTIYDEV